MLEEDEDEEDDEGVDEYTRPMPGGIALGAHPNALQLRGWLGSVSLRSMALFEYLACGRRRMPFGYEPGEPFGEYCGYLTPDEVGQMAMILSDVKPPRQSEVEKAHKSFYEQQTSGNEPWRLIDEVLPANTYEFLTAVRRAAYQELGLICSVD